VGHCLFTLAHEDCDGGSESRRNEDRPDRDRLAIRFEQFKKSVRFNSYGFPIDAKQIPGFSALNERRAAGRLDIGSDLGSAASAMTNASY
jgi:hypothetical protein